MRVAMTLDNEAVEKIIREHLRVKGIEVLEVDIEHEVDYSMKPVQLQITVRGTLGIKVT